MVRAPADAWCASRRMSSGRRRRAGLRLVRAPADVEWAIGVAPAGAGQRRACAALRRHYPVPMSVPGFEPLDTPALRAIAATGVPFTVVRTTPARDPEESARLQGIALSALLRTIVVRRGTDDYVFVLVPAGRRFDWPRLRAHLGVSRLSLPDQEEAKAVTGYERGAITPFGAIRAWPVVADASIVGLDRVAIGGGVRGVNLHLAPTDLVAALGAEVADVTDAPETPST
jgi:Cys-tRNA(Pro)/Cys-tRNA(Cys) deacylase